MADICASLGRLQPAKDAAENTKRGLPKLPPRGISPKVKRNTSTLKLLCNLKPGETSSRASMFQDSISGKLITMDKEKRQKRARHHRLISKKKALN